MGIWLLQNQDYYITAAVIYTGIFSKIQEDAMKRIPQHIGIIPDGNRRWAKVNVLKKGYVHGLEPGLKLIKITPNYGIKELTYYGFTVDNFKRPKEQVTAFSKACINAVEMAGQENTELYAIGNTSRPVFLKSCFHIQAAGIKQPVTPKH